MKTAITILAPPEQGIVVYLFPALLMLSNKRRLSVIRKSTHNNALRTVESPEVLM